MKLCFKTRSLASRYSEIQMMVIIIRVLYMDISVSFHILTQSCHCSTENCLLMLKLLEKTQKFNSLFSLLAYCNNCLVSSIRFLTDLNFLVMLWLMHSEDTCSFLSMCCLGFFFVLFFQNASWHFSFTTEGYLKWPVGVYWKLMGNSARQDF